MTSNPGTQKRQEMSYTAVKEKYHLMEREESDRLVLESRALPLFMVGPQVGGSLSVNNGMIDPVLSEEDRGEDAVA